MVYSMTKTITVCSLHVPYIKDIGECDIKDIGECEHVVSDISVNFLAPVKLMGILSSLSIGPGFYVFSLLLQLFGLYM